MEQAGVIRDGQSHVKFTFAVSAEPDSPDIKRVLVPEGREIDLEVLERELRKQLPKAVVELTADEE